MGRHEGAKCFSNTSLTKKVKAYDSRKTSHSWKKQAEQNPHHHMTFQQTLPILHRAEEVTLPLCSGSNRWESREKKSYPAVSGNFSGINKCLVWFAPMSPAPNNPSFTVALEDRRKSHLCTTVAIGRTLFGFLPPAPLCAENTWLQEHSRRDFFPPLA